MFYDASSSTPPKGTERPEDLLEIDLDKHEHILETEGDDDHMLAKENRVNAFDSSPFPKETLLKEEGVPREADPVRGGIGGSPVATSQKEEQIAGADEIVSDGPVSSPGVQLQSVSGTNLSTNLTVFSIRALLHTFQIQQDDSAGSS